MKINFASQIGNSLSQVLPRVLVLTEEEVKKSTSKAVKFAKENFSFEGKFGQSALVSETVLIGAGIAKKVDELALQKIGSSVVAFLNSVKIKQAVVLFESEDLAQVAFGALLQSYRFNKYLENKKKDKELKLESLTFVTSDSSKVQKEFAPLKILAENIFFVHGMTFVYLVYKKNLQT